MHKKIKYIIAATLVMGIVSGVVPADSFILGSTKAYASTYSSASTGELSSLTITRSTGSELKLCDSYYGDEVSLSNAKDYYLELTGAEGFDIAAEVKGSGYVVKIFNSASKTQKGVDISEYVKIDSTYTDIYLRTYKSEDAYKEAYDDGDVTDCENTYAIHVKKPVVVSEEEEDKDYAYLKSIYLSNGDIDFLQSQYSYDVNVGDNVEEILVRATPEDDDDVVEINGASVEDSDNYEKTVKLNKGNNKIEIYVKGDEDDETYTLNVYRGNAAVSTSASSSSSTQNSEIQNNTSKFNSWQRIGEKLKYVDGTGQILKNQWWYDKDTGKNYYLKEDGARAIGWFSDDSKWYYFNETGEMQTGWVCLDRNWYYLNKSGAMQMGWLEDSAGNWYYLDSSGVMQTGWVENSDGKWYYFDSTGKMANDTPISR